jgi:hypothetical protein
MKKLVLALVLFTIIAAGSVFAEHPDGLGIGVQGGISGSWESGVGLHNGLALSLKLPGTKTFWAGRLDIWDKYFFLGISADKYLIDNLLVKDIGLGWYLGGGLGAAIGIGDPFGLGVTLRLPIGLTFQPIPLLEIFLQAVPQIGVAILPSFHFPYGGWGGDLGIRLWF